MFETLRYSRKCISGASPQDVEGGARLWVKGGDLCAVSFGSEHTIESAREFLAETLNVKDAEIEKTSFRLLHKNKKKNLAFGLSYVVEEKGEAVNDHSGRDFTIETIEKSTYDFVSGSPTVGEMHQDMDRATLVESFVLTKEKIEVFAQLAGVEKLDLPIGVWQGFHVPDDDLFAKIESGELGFLSVAGFAREVPR